VATIHPGQRVVVPFQISYGGCPACRAGRTANCTSVPPVSMYGFGLAGGHWGGALAEQLAVPYADAMLVALPDGIEPVAAASVADNVCDAHRHVAPHLPELLRRDPEASVLVLGALSPNTRCSASVPLYTALIAQTLGARQVLVVDARPYARARAHRLGLEALPPEQLAGQRGAPLVVDLTTTGPGLGWRWRAPLPTVCAAAREACTGQPAFPCFGHTRATSRCTSRGCTRAMIPQVLELISAGGLHPQTVTTTVASIEDAPTALREHYLAGAQGRAQAGAPAAPPPRWPACPRAGAGARGPGFQAAGRRGQPGPVGASLGLRSTSTGWQVHPPDGGDQLPAPARQPLPQRAELLQLIREHQPPSEASPRTAEAGLSWSVCISAAVWSG
jgi:threonine dehydrogenase-like Zn-dependent dehydrogenase